LKVETRSACEQLYSNCFIYFVSYFPLAGELWGLATHPTDPDVFATCGDDKTIRIWSILARRLLRKAIIGNARLTKSQTVFKNHFSSCPFSSFYFADCTARSVAWSPDGSYLIVGMGGAADGKRQRKDGAFLILEAATLKPLYEGR
jgi:microtubule-associated protein-like 6